MTLAHNEPCTTLSKGLGSAAHRFDDVKALIQWSLLCPNWVESRHSHKHERTSALGPGGSSTLRPLWAHSSRASV